MKTYKQFISEAQEHTSAGTSLNQVSAGIKHAVKTGLIKQNSVNVDYGGGKYDTAKEHVESNVGGAKMHVHDKFNRSSEHNDQVERYAKGKAHYVGMHNVLNVIKEPDERQNALHGAGSFLHPHGTLHITTYEGDRSGNGRVSKKDNGGGSSWQNHRPTKTYVDEVKKAFPEHSHNVTLKGKHILVTKK